MTSSQASASQSDPGPLPPNDPSDPALPGALIRDLAAAMSGPELFETLARWIPSVLSLDRASIAIAPGPNPDGLEILAIGEDLIIERGTILPVKGSLVGRSFLTQKTVCVDDLTTEPAFEGRLLAAGGLRSALTSPLVSGGKCFGTLNIASVEVGHYKPGDIALLASIASLVASFLRVQEIADIANINATTDELTGQLNRRGILEHLRKVAPLSKTATSVLYIDLDDFKSINDAHGHDVGDRIIRIIERRIASELAADERVGRLGGDEFLVVVTDDPTGSTARSLAQRLVAKCNEPTVVGTLSMTARMSIGVATETASPEAASRLMVEADMAMYSAKRSLEPIAVVDQRIRQTAVARATVDREVAAAMTSGMLRFEYQPVRSLATGALGGAEALLRWTHPELGPIAPPAVIERIEATGRINAFTQWSIATIARDLAEIRATNAAFAEMSVSINLSPRQLRWSDYLETHLEALQRYGLEPPDIAVEVVESSEIQAGDTAEATLRRLADAGVSIALDDFGTGHNALRYFAMFPVHTIKFDRSLVGLVCTSNESRVILKGLTSLARELGIETLAEGIETEAEQETCRALGVQRGQGWHLGRPMSPAALAALAESEHATASQ